MPEFGLTLLTLRRYYRPGRTGPMRYRFYEVDADNQVLKAVTLEFFSDAEALAAAEAWAGSHGQEIWQASRRVGGIEPRQPPSPSAESLLT